MYSKQNLQKRFKEAGLTLEFGTMIDGGGTARAGLFDTVKIFGVRVARKTGGNRRDEWFVMQPGEDDNDIQVVDVNKEFHQVLLVVKEQVRTFTDVRWVKGEDGKEKKETFKRKTRDNTRKFLLGLDERQLFMCQVRTNSRSVLHAHSLLKNPIVHTAEGKLGRATRQGEWFFLPTTDQERRNIENGIKSSKLFIRKKHPIGAGPHGRVSGNPHTADELVVVPAVALEHGFPIRGDGEIYVRGKIRHIDHKTVEFPVWRRVLKNTEERADTVGSWID